jgi:predicted DNA-binding protein (MmcQ/YjbR family)
MDNERIRAICMALPHVTETVNWGHHLVYWAGNRDSGGKMFAMTDLEGTGTGVLWFHCGPERFHELLEVEGIIPSPYLARAHWVTVERWDVLRTREYEDELRRSHALVFERLPRRLKLLLAAPPQTPWPDQKRRKKAAVKAKAATAKAAKKPAQARKVSARRKSGG